LFLLLTFAPIVYFCAPSRPAATDKDGMPLPACALLCAAALALIYLASPLIAAGFADPAASAKRVATFATRFPLYQAFAVLWLLGWTVALGIKWRSRPRAIVSALACIAGGVGLGLLSLSGAAPGNITVVFNPLEQMIGFIPHAETPGAPPPSFLRLVLDSAMLLLARLTFVLSTSARSTVFLGWLILAGIVHAWRHGAKAVAAQAALMFVAACAVDFVGALRGLKLEYFIITDPLLILAAAWLLAKAPSLQRHRLVLPVGLLLFGAMIAVGMAEPVKHSFKSDVPLDFCRPNYYYTSRIERFSFCPR
jgi:cbb3-type cytochrome oxidase subunit 3